MHHRYGRTISTHRNRLRFHDVIESLWLEGQNARNGLLVLSPRDFIGFVVIHVAAGDHEYFIPQFLDRRLDPLSESFERSITAGSDRDGHELNIRAQVKQEGELNFEGVLELMSRGVVRQEVAVPSQTPRQSLVDRDRAQRRFPTP